MNEFVVFHLLLLQVCEIVYTQSVPYCIGLKIVADYWRGSPVLEYQSSLLDR